MGKRVAIYKVDCGLPPRFDRVFGIFWKCARVGERLSPYVSICCVVMAVSPPGSSDATELLERY